MAAPHTLRGERPLLSAALAHASPLFGMPTHTNARAPCRFVIDAEGQRLGRLASLAATYVRGKHLPTYHPAMDMGDRIIVINAEKVTVSGKKHEQKLYRRVTNGRPGSMKVETFDQLQVRLRLLPVCARLNCQTVFLRQSLPVRILHRRTP